VYRVPKPVEFLRKQRNLHRIRVEGNYVGEGLANALRAAWDGWFLKSRKDWRALFTREARQEVLAEAPELRLQPGVKAPSRFSQDPQYKPLKGFELQDSFRYPVSQAKPIEPPADVKLAGSSSEFIPSSTGNVMIPIGTRAPGLYLVEAVVGQHRATTVVFVSDTVAVTKISSHQLLVWTADRKSGEPVAGTQLTWSDGVGVLKSGSSEHRGVAILEREAPEQTYVFGEDGHGGVFISENFYYDSEIYNAKLYATSDRPLYRPGDLVSYTIVGRDFTSARVSRPVPDGTLDVEVFDPNGLPVDRQRLAFQSAAGAASSGCPTTPPPGATRSASAAVAIAMARPSALPNTRSRISRSRSCRARTPTAPGSPSAGGSSSAIPMASRWSAPLSNCWHAASR
jgi:alpha-2-macroglobulin